MATKLEWSGDALLLGAVRVAKVVRAGDWWRFKIPMNERSEFFSVGYEATKDCRQDCESVVRRLLKEAGVTIAD